MQAAMGNIESQSSVSETLTNLDNMINIDLDINLPNGQKYVKTKRTQYVPPRPQSSHKVSLFVIFIIKVIRNVLLLPRLLLKKR